MTENITFVPSRLKSSVVGGYVTGADQVFDDALGKSQAEINSGIDAIVEDKVTQQVNTARKEISGQVPTIINQTLYGSDTKPEGAEPITSENFSDKLSQSLDGAIGTALDGRINSALDQKLENLDIDTNTTYKLSVNGTVKGDASGDDLGAVFAPTTAGTNGQFLKSNGSGAPVWADMPSGSGEVPTEPVSSASDKWNDFNIR